jgi:hypothetical protein
MAPWRNRTMILSDTETVPAEPEQLEVMAMSESSQNRANDKQVQAAKSTSEFLSKKCRLEPEKPLGE